MLVSSLLSIQPFELLHQQRSWLTCAGVLVCWCRVYTLLDALAVCQALLLNWHLVRKLGNWKQVRSMMPCRLATILINCNSSPLVSAGSPAISDMDVKGMHAQLWACDGELEVDVFSMCTSHAILEKRLVMAATGNGRASRLA